MARYILSVWLVCCVSLTQLVSIVVANEHQIDGIGCQIGKSFSGQLTADSHMQKLRLANDTNLFRAGGILLSKNVGLQKFSSAEAKLFVQNEKQDRYGRLSAQVFDKDQKNWLQGEVLSKGEAFLFANGQSTACIAALREAENLARLSGRGVWEKNSSDSIGPINSATEPDILLARVGHFAIIEGVVLSVGNRSTRLYLNFGQNWRQDFTVSIAKKGAGAFKGDLDQLTMLNGKRIRVRGILEDSQGPLIRLFDEGNITVVGP